MWRAPVATDTLDNRTGTGGAQGLRRLLLDNGALSALVVLVAALALLSRDFLTTPNLLNVGVHRPVGRLGGRALGARARLVGDVRGRAGVARRPAGRRHRPRLRPRQRR